MSLSGRWNWNPFNFPTTQQSWNPFNWQAPSWLQFTTQPQPAAVQQLSLPPAPAVVAQPAPVAPTPVIFQPAPLAETELPRNVAVALQGAGLNVIVPEEAQPSIPNKWFDERSRQSLKSYEYDIDAREWQRLQAMSGSQQPQAGLGPTVKSKDNEGVRLTDEAYDKLSDEQKAALAWNEQLVKAREKDLAVSVGYDEAGRKAYDKRVEAIFGVGNGAEIYAPNTLNLLEAALRKPGGEELKSKLIGQDLDDFLSLDAAIDVAELKDFKLPDSMITDTERFSADVADTPPGQVWTSQDRAMLGDYTNVRSREDRNLAAGLAVRGLKENMSAIATSPKGQTSDKAQALGVALGNTPVPLGFAITDEQRNTRSPEDKKREKMWQDAFFNGIVLSQGDLTDLWAAIRQVGWKDQEVKDFFQFVDDYTRYEMRTGADKARGGISASDIRKTLGWKD